MRTANGSNQIILLTFSGGTAPGYTGVLEYHFQHAADSLQIATEKPARKEAGAGGIPGTAVAVDLTVMIWASGLDLS